jgi:peptidoglycan/LPS O-acetylase OafA/YrhL
MKWFRALEGTRAWLAWTVVFAHVLGVSGLSAKYPRLALMNIAGDVAVRVFIILSGFAIYGLITGRDEKPIPFLIRRFFRLYPVYIICLLAGACATWSLDSVTPAHPFAPHLLLSTRGAQEIRGFHDHMWLYVGAHLTMLHGVIPNNVLYESEYMPLSPAWSLSLEWQFYLFAPLVVFLIQKPVSGLVLAILTAALAALYDHGKFGSWILPSFLPGAAFLFATGIASRIIVDKLDKRFQFSPALVITIAAGVALFDPRQLHFAVWFAVLSYSIAADPADRVERVAQRAMHLGLDSPIANWLGARSYSTYLIHYPIIQGLVYACAAARLPWVSMVLATAVLTPILVVLAAQVLHETVEMPGMALGRSAARTLNRSLLRPVRAGARLGPSPGSERSE